MKILFVCMQYIHSARWVNQLKDSEHEIFLFDCLDMPIHEDLKWTKYTDNWSQRKLTYIKGEFWLEKNFPFLFSKIEPFLKVTASEKLKELIKEIKPDLVHSLEMQSETYPLLKVRRDINFKWAFSCWGNDVFFYKDLDAHKFKINEVIALLDYCFLECERDKKLIKSINNTTKVLGTKFPGGGGYKINKYKTHSKPLKERKLIIIKGYEHKFGRALSVLKALEFIIDDIKSIDIYIYSAHKIVIEKIFEFNEKYNLNIEYSSRYNQLTHSELLEKFGQAKIAIGNNISDGVPNTLLEAIICGAFPIQSNPGGASEDYIVHNKNGLLIKNPEDSKEIAKQIKKALINDELLKNAFSINQEIAKKLDHNLIKKEVLKAYKQIEADV